MSETQGQSDYLAYQLRLWQTYSGERAIWRVSLVSARTRESEGFAGLDELFDFLRQQTSEYKKELAQNGLTNRSTTYPRDPPSG